MQNKDEKWLLEEKYRGVTSDEYRADLARLKRGEPLAYVIGSIPFLGLTIHLDSHPLIPRPETEFWTEEFIKTLSPGSRVLDLCAGSGAIGLAVLKHVPGASVSFGEIDPAHEATIRKNIRENRLDESRATICIGDLFAPFAGERFDAVAANPPYIPEGRELDASVADFEPALALFSGADGLDLVGRIVAHAREYLANEGALWIEVDESNAEKARDAMERAGFASRIIPDQYGVSRVVVGYWGDSHGN